MNHLLPLSTSPEESKRGATVAVLPVGSFEQHGAFLPLSTDTLIASVIAQRIAACYDLLLLPAISFSCSHEHAAWHGTVSISSRTLHLVINDIAESLKQSGVEKLALVNGHGGNYSLSNVVQEANIPSPRMTLFPGKDDWKTARGAAGLQTTMHEDMHAGEIETSVLMHALPEAVRPGFESADHLADDRQHLLVHGLRAYTESGVIGTPSLGSADKGKAVLASLVNSFQFHLEALNRRS